nr:Carboxylic ester hydrolase [Metisa plana]
MSRIAWMLAMAVSALCAWVVAEERASRVVSTTQGPVRGYRRPHTSYYAFYSIPYATAPTGHQKFKAPLSPPTWEKIFDAKEEYIICPQNLMFMDMLQKDLNYKIKDDCLVINVFMPEKIINNLPVYVFVHGGGFQFGFGNMFNHTALIESGQIVVVNFNYRLGAHGFLCLGTEDVPGNAGMKDQVAALQWVKRNIANFGGNPDDVTLAGNSAGAAAAELLLLSKSTRGLFNKVIPESGSGAGVWAVQSKPLDIAKSYARLEGYKGVEDVFALEKFYKDLPFEQLQKNYFMDNKDNTMGFVPCIERKDSEYPFLTEAPTSIISKGDYEKLPLLVGFADMEGMSRLSFLEVWKEDMNENFSDFLPVDLHFNNDAEQQTAVREIKEFYFGDQEISAETALGFVNYISDVMFVYPAYRSVSLMAAAGSESLYLYLYAYPDEKLPGYPGVTGASHGTQSIALIDIICGEKKQMKDSEDFNKVKKLLADVWQNFIIKGDPTPPGSLAASALGTWRPMLAARPAHVLFNASSELRAELWPDRMALWERLYARHYRAPTPPPAPPTKTKTEL